MKKIFLVVFFCFCMTSFVHAKEGVLYLGEAIVPDRTFAYGFRFVQTNKECATLVNVRDWTGSLKVCKGDGKNYFNFGYSLFSLEWVKPGMVKYRTKIIFRQSENLQF